MVADSVPVLTNLLMHDDSRLVESACSCLTLMVGRCRLTLSKPELKACLVSAVDTVM